MKQVYSTVPIGVLVFTFLTLLIFNGVATYFGNDLIPNITRVVSVIVLLTAYFLVRNRMANVFLTVFLCSLIGDGFHVFDFGQVSNKISNIFYVCSYCLLIFVLLRRLKRFKIDGLVSLYLIIVLALNSYFLYVFYSAIRESMYDNTTFYIAICHGIVLIAMSLFAFSVYLSQETSQSIIFLLMVFCFVFSDVLTYICNFYVYFWAFEFISNMLHVVSLGLFFAYVYHHKTVDTDRNVSFDSYMMSNSGGLTA